MSVSGNRKNSSTMETANERLRLRRVCLGVEVGVKLPSVRGNSEGCTNLIRRSISNSWHIKSKATKLFHRVMSRWLTLWYKKMTNTLTMPGTFRTMVRRNIGSKILGETSVKKLLHNKNTMHF